MLFVFMLSTFVGFQVIQNVSRLLHVPLMSLTNAISAIAIVGSIIIAGEEKSTVSTILGAIAVAASMTNIVSGFLITGRMLNMFWVKGKPERSAIEHITQATYLTAAALFIFSLRWLSTPKTARKGVLAGVLGMALAIVGKALHPHIVSFKWIVVALIVGTAIGIPLAQVRLTAVPQRTGLSHAFSGLARGRRCRTRGAAWPPVWSARRNTCCGCGTAS